MTLESATEASESGAHIAVAQSPSEAHTAPHFGTNKQGLCTSYMHSNCLALKAEAYMLAASCPDPARPSGCFVVFWWGFCWAAAWGLADGSRFSPSCLQSRFDVTAPSSSSSGGSWFLMGVGCAAGRCPKARGSSASKSLHTFPAGKKPGRLSE